MESKFEQLALQGNQVVGGERADGFELKRAFTFSKGLWDQSEFAGISSRDKLVQKLDSTIDEMGGSVKI